MLKQGAIAGFRDFLRELAERIGSDPDGIEVSPFGPFTGMVHFGGNVTQEQAEAMEAELARHPKVAEDGTIWMDEYLDVSGQDDQDGSERCLLFDVSDSSMFVLTSDEIARHREQFIIKIDDRWRNGPRNVFLPIRFGYFDAIKSGSKTVECRQYTQNWVKRLLGPKVETITFQRGYEAGAEKIVRKVARIELEDEDGKTRYPPDAIPDMAMPALILLHLS